MHGILLRLIYLEHIALTVIRELGVSLNIIVFDHCLVILLDLQLVYLWRHRVYVICHGVLLTGVIA